VRRPDAIEVAERFFEDVEVGTTIPVREFGPHTLTSAVFWAAVQEHPGPLHFDRDYVREFRGAKSIVVSGQQRQSFLTRTLLDWGGPRAFLSKMNCRHRASTYEGDMQCYSGTIVEKSPDPDDPWIVCEFEGHNQAGENILGGRCTIRLPRRGWPLDRRVWEPGTV
jgi:acyl dehydratase